MAVDPSVRRSILQVLYAGRKADEVRTPAVAEELDLDLELVEAYLDVMEEEGLVNVSRRFGGGHRVELTSRGLLEAKSQRQGPETPGGEGGAATPRLAAPEKTKRLVLDPGEARRKLQEQLGEVEALIARGRSATLDEIKDWTYWTVTVIEKVFGENSRELWEFRGVSGGVWPGGHEDAEAEGYRERLPQWRRLLRTWIRGIDEFGIPGPAEAAAEVEATHAEASAMGETPSEYFVAHEFTQEKTDDLRRAIDEALAGSGLTPYYADNEVKEGHIFTNKILLKIRATRFGIYDLSNPRKANVFMELGAAIAMRKPYFIICEQGTELPSDVLGLDRIEYESYVDLTRQLKAKVAKASRGAA